MDKLKGNPKPRLLAPTLPRFTRTNTLGFAAVDFARDKLGMTLMPHQEFILKAGLLLRRNGTFKFRTILVIMGRQSGKSTTMQMLSLWRMYGDDAKLVIATSANLRTAVETFRGSVEMAQNAGLLDLKNVRWANGMQSFTAPNKARYLVAANNRSSARGLSADLVLLDELREHRDWTAWNAVSKTITARPRGQRWCFSSGGERDAVVLRSLRERALQAGDESDVLLLEWSAEPDADISDPEAWCAAVPALGRTVPVQSIVDDLATDPPATFRVETLCQQVDAMHGAIDPTAWSDCTDPGTLSAHRSRVVVALDVSPDLRHATAVAAAQLPDKRVRVEVVGTYDSTSDIRALLPDLLAKIKPRHFVWLPAGPAAAISTDLKAITNNQELSGSQVTAACQGLAELVAAGRIAHSGDQLLSAHVLGARKVTVGDGWKFSRKDGSWIDAAYSVAAAVHVARTIAPSSRLRFITPK